MSTYTVIMADRGLNPFILACCGGELEEVVRVADELHITGGEVRYQNNLIFRVVCFNGHLDIAQWLVARFCLIVDDVRASDDFALKMAAKQGRAEVARWLLDWIVLSAEERSKILEGVSEQALTPAIRDLFSTWQPPPGPGDKPAQD